jgi:hypothetical protein
MKWLSYSELPASGFTNLCDAVRYQSFESVNVNIALTLKQIKQWIESGTTKETVLLPDLRLPLTSEDIARLERSYITRELARDAGLFRVDSVEGGRLVGRNGSRDYS